MHDWVLNAAATNAELSITADRIRLSNGLVQREVETAGCRTVSLQNNQKQLQLISAARGDFAVSIDGKTYLSDRFTFIGAQETAPLSRVPFHRTPTMTATGDYPPPGKAVLLTYQSQAPALRAVVRYELYDGMPVFMKQVTVYNDGNAPYTVDNIYTELLDIRQHRETLFVDSDYDSSTDFLGLDLEKYAKHYARYRYDILEVAPQFRMNVTLSPGEALDSITAFELLHGADYYEQKLVEVKQMYRRIAPWCSDQVLFFHLISNSAKQIRKAVEQCAEVGLEMIIQSFGSGVNMESDNEAYLARIRDAYDYGHEHGLRMGAYTLAYVKNYRPVRGDEALNHDGSHICRCLACEWAEGYMQRVLRFIDKTGADAVEIDGPYGMLMCAGGKTHRHDDFTDSQYKQWKAAVVDWYRQIKQRGVYINAPDWHFLNGSNRTGVGYEEIAFSEKREEQLITSRIYYYKGTFSKNPSQGWGFLPLNVYHGGGEQAQFFPTEENRFAFDWAMAQLTAAGVWPTIRGKQVYDSETGKLIMKKWISVFKTYRRVLNGITVHFLPPRIDTQNPTRTTCIDAIMNQLPEGEVRGFVMFFNQTEEKRTEKITLPVYYTGLTALNAPPPPPENTKNCDVSYPVYGEEIAPLVIKARDGSARTYITDAKVEDLPIPPLPPVTPSGKTLLLSEEDNAPQRYEIDKNGNVILELTMEPMSYRWFVIRPDDQ